MSVSKMLISGCSSIYAAVCTSRVCVRAYGLCRVKKYTPVLWQRQANRAYIRTFAVREESVFGFLIFNFYPSFPFAMNNLVYNLSLIIQLKKG